MKAIDLSGFAAKFAADEDPWRTFSNRDEAVKRAAILHALGPGPLGRVLELGSGNGSNSRAIAPRALRLDATEGYGGGHPPDRAGDRILAPRAGDHAGTARPAPPAGL